jgi:hypothetical protein
MSSNNCDIDINTCKKSKKLKKKDIEDLAIKCNVDPNEYKNRDDLCEAIVKKNNPDFEEESKCNKITFENCLVADLRKIAKDEGYTGYTSLKKKELIQFIKDERLKKGAKEKGAESEEKEEKPKKDKSKKEQYTSEKLKKIIISAVRSFGKYSTIIENNISRSDILKYIEKNNNITKEILKKVDYKEIINEELIKMQTEEETKSSEESSDESDDEPIIKKPSKRVSPISEKPIFPKVTPQVPKVAPPIPPRRSVVPPVPSIRQPPPVPPRRSRRESPRAAPSPMKPSSFIYPTGDVEDVISSITKSNFVPTTNVYKPLSCNPVNDEYCEEGFSCDVTDLPGKCIANENVKNLQKMTYKGHKIVGTRDAILNLNKILNNIGKGVGEYKNQDFLSDRYFIGAKVRVIKTNKIGKIIDVLNDDNKILIEFFEGTPPKLYTEDQIYVLEEGEDIEEMEEEVEEEEVGDEEEEVEEEEEEVGEEDEEKEKINFKDVKDFLRNIDEIPDDKLKNLNIVNNQILKCLGLL